MFDIFDSKADLKKYSYIVYKELYWAVRIVVLYCGKESSHM